MQSLCKLCAHTEWKEPVVIVLEKEINYICHQPGKNIRKTWLDPTPIHSKPFPTVDTQVLLSSKTRRPLVLFLLST